MYTVLICDDDKDIRNAVQIYLSADGYEVITAGNGREALSAIAGNEVHLVLLDIMMPQMDGIETLQHIRKVSNVPVIFLTAKGEETDKILGLNIGADDYITKPFNPAELQARVRSHLRRYTQLGAASPAREVLRIGGIELDDAAKQVSLDGKTVSLTPREYDILFFLMSHPGTVFSPQEIYRKVWKDVPVGADNTVAVHIRHLREKLEYDPAEPRYLKVVWGIGYKIEKQ